MKRKMCGMRYRYEMYRFQTGIIPKIYQKKMNHVLCERGGIH